MWFSSPSPQPGRYWLCAGVFCTVETWLVGVFDLTTTLLTACAASLAAEAA